MPIDTLYVVGVFELTSMALMLLGEFSAVPTRLARLSMFPKLIVKVGWWGGLLPRLLGAPVPPPTGGAWCTPPIIRKTVFPWPEMSQANPARGSQSTGAVCR